MAYQIEGGSEYNNIQIEKKPKGQIGAPVEGSKGQILIKNSVLKMFFLIPWTESNQIWCSGC